MQDESASRQAFDQFEAGRSEWRRYLEGELLLADVDESFKWRGNPEQTFSDWTIEIVTHQPPRDDDGKGSAAAQPSIASLSEVEVVETVTVYHVHKCILGYGRRKSEYFFKLFHTEGFSENRSATSRIVLDHLAASAFPALLDYMYAPESPLNASTNTATSLHFLADYFEMRQLRWDTGQFCMKDISLENIALYYEHAEVFQDYTLLDFIADYVKKNLMNIDPSSAIIEKGKPEFWIRTLVSPEEGPVDHSRSIHWSKLVAEIGTIRILDMNKTTFDKLTDSSQMPIVHSDAALILYGLNEEIHGNKLSPEAKKDKENSISLQRRCSTALAETWQQLKQNKATVKTLEARTPAFLASLLLQSLENARSELVSCRQELERAAQLQATTEQTLAETQNELKHTCDELKQKKAEQSKLRPVIEEPRNYRRMAVPQELKNLNKHFKFETGNMFGILNGSKYGGPSKVSPLLYYVEDEIEYQGHIYY